MRDAGGEPRRRGRARALVTFAACALAALFLPAAALASNHLVKLRELYAGRSSSPADEYVEVQMYSTGENFFSEGVSLHLYDATGNETLSFTPTTDVANGQTQRRVLFATQTAQATFGMSGDFTLPSGDHIADAGGAACYVSGTPGFVDCVSWGNFNNASGTPLPSSTGGNVDPTSGIADGMAIDRSIAGRCPTLLEASDDTDSPSNWADGAPDPLDNSAVPHEHPCANTIITKAPDRTTTDRTPTFKFKSTQKPATFKCKLDGGPFKRCVSPDRLHRLTLGKHTFKVRARSGGFTDPTPARKSFKVVKKRG